MPEDKDKKGTPPRTVNKDDYVWCEHCAAMIFKKHLHQREGFFTDDPKEQLCPAGHALEIRDDGK